MNAARLRLLGQALTALSAGVIAYATLSPNITAGGANATLAHFLLFFPMGVGSAFWMALLPAPARRRVIVIMFVILLFFAAATEVAQGSIDGRTPSLEDWMMDAAGAALGLAVGRFIVARLVGRDRSERS